MMKIIEKFRATIERHHLITTGDTVLVAVSGGADSVCLLHLLAGLRHELGIKLICGHINHHLRRSSDADERFVAAMAKKLAVPFYSTSVKVNRKKGSLEEMAREARLKALTRIARRCKADSIALAHHQDDAAETVLMRILRGTGLQGLQGILPRRVLYGFTFVRPLLEVTRKDIGHYLRAYRLNYRTDPTNRHKRFFRNRIRLELLPLLERKYQPNSTAILANLAETAALDYGCLLEQAEKIFSRAHRKKADTVRLHLATLQPVHPALRRMVLRRAISELNGNLRRLTLTHLKEIEDLLENRPAGSVVTLPNRLAVKKEEKSLRLSLRSGSQS